MNTKEYEKNRRKIIARMRYNIRQGNPQWNNATALANATNIPERIVRKVILYNLVHNGTLELHSGIYFFLD